MRWYILRVQTSREEKIKEALERRINAEGLAGTVGRVVIPTEKISEIRGGKKRVKEQKIFPGYLMIEMVLNENTWYLIRETPGVGDFIGTTKPIPMAPHEVDRVLMESTATEERPKIKIEFQKGDHVRIKEGPFENFEGVVDEVIPAKGLVVVTVTIFGRATPVELEYWQVEAT